MSDSDPAEIKPSQADGSGNEESVARLASDVVKQVRLGKRPSEDDLEDEYPEIAGDVQGLVKTLSILEEASFRQRTATSKRDVVINPAGMRREELGGFHLIREISRGGMGIVYEAEQPTLQRRVALKVLPPSPLLTDVERARFKREATAVARLHHSNIVPIFVTGEDDGVQYCVMQFIEGYSLDRIITRLRQRYLSVDEQSSNSTNRAGEDQTLFSHPVTEDKPEPPESPEDIGLGFSLDDAITLLMGQADAAEMTPEYFRNVADLGARAADALHHAHQQGVLHRDIKPGNLMLDRENHAWVADFGLAKMRDTANLTLTQNLIGTLRYTPPEQFEGRADARSDVYSLGLTLYELCTLRPAFSAEDRAQLMNQVLNEVPTQPSQHVNSIPKDLERIIQKAISPEPARRYQTAEAFNRDLQNFLEDLPVTARRQTRIQHAWRWCRRNPREAIWATAAASMLMVAAGVAAFAYLRESSLRQESELTAEKTRKAFDQVYQSFVPGWSSANGVSHHGSISLSPSSARFLDEALGFYDDLTTRDDQTIDKVVAMDAANAKRRVALIYHRLGEFDRSRFVYRQANQQLLKCYSQNSTDDVRLERARALNELGAAFANERHFRHANANHTQSLSLLQAIDGDSELVKSDVVQFEIARTLYLLYRLDRDLAGAVTHREGPRSSGTRPLLPLRESKMARAVSILEDLADRDTADTRYRQLLSLCYREQASLNLATDGAQSSLVQQSIRELEGLADFAPEQLAFRYELCVSLTWLRLSDQCAKPALELALERHLRAKGIVDKLVGERPNEWLYAITQIEVLLRLAQNFALLDRHDESKATNQQALKLVSKYARSFPEADALLFLMGLAEFRCGEDATRIKDPDLATQHFQNAVKQFNRVSRERNDWESAIILHRNEALEKMTVVSKQEKQDGGKPIASGKNVETP